MSRLPALALVLSFLATAAFAQDAKKEIQKYQQMIAEGSPVELFELEGEALWKKPQGPKNVSLETIPDMRRWSKLIVAQTVQNRAMPMGNQTGMTDEERAALGRWVDGLK